MDEIVTGWSNELEERTREFGDVAADVREWDRVLRDNGEQISQLYNSVLPLSPLQTQITSSLDYIESQQKELSDVLDNYEKEIGDLVDQSATGAGWRGGSGAGGAEREREKAYTLATSLSSSLDTTSTSLTSLIQTLNALSPSFSSSSNGKDDDSASNNEDALVQIAAILNAHLGSLKWIESTTDGLKKNVRDLEGRVGEVAGKVGRGGGAGGNDGVRDSPGGPNGRMIGTPSRLGHSQRSASPFVRR